MELDSKLVELVDSIFPKLNTELESQLDKKSKEMSNKVLKNIQLFTRQIMPLVHKVFNDFKHDFHNFSIEPNEFMIFLQQNNSDILNYLKQFPNTYEKLDQFFKILGKKRENN